jgi:hypothetical protein
MTTRAQDDEPVKPVDIAAQLPASRSMFRTEVQARRSPSPRRRTVRLVTGTITIDTTIGSNVQWENIYIDGNYLASSPPETFQWDTTSVPDGSHTISAEAFASGRVLQGTASVTVNVGN